MTSNFFSELFKTDIYPTSPDEMARMGQHWGWFVAAGFAYLVLGFVAFSLPIATTLGLTFMVATLLIIAGVIQLFQAVRLRHRRGRVTRFFQCLLSLIAGGLMLRYPGGGVLSMTIVLSFYFFISAAAQWILAMSLRPQKDSTWGLIGAMCSFALGLYIVFTFPFSALWIPGVLLAIDLIIAGGLTIGFALSLRTHYRRSKGLTDQQSSMGSPLQPSGQMP